MPVLHLGLPSVALAASSAFAGDIQLPRSGPLDSRPSAAAGSVASPTFGAATPNGSPKFGGSFATSRHRCSWPKDANVPGRALADLVAEAGRQGDTALRIFRPAVPATAGPCKARSEGGGAAGYVCERSGDAASSPVLAAPFAGGRAHSEACQAGACPSTTTRHRSPPPLEDLVAAARGNSSARSGARDSGKATYLWYRRASQPAVKSSHPTADVSSVVEAGARDGGQSVAAADDENRSSQTRAAGTSAATPASGAGQGTQGSVAWAKEVPVIPFEVQSQSPTVDVDLSGSCGGNTDLSGSTRSGTLDRSANSELSTATFGVEACEGLPGSDAIADEHRSMVVRAHLRQHSVDPPFFEAAEPVTLSGHGASAWLLAGEAGAPNEEAGQVERRAATGAVLVASSPRRPPTAVRIAMPGSRDRKSGYVRSSSKPMQVEDEDGFVPALRSSGLQGPSSSWRQLLLEAQLRNPGSVGFRARVAQDDSALIAGASKGCPLSPCEVRTVAAGFHIGSQVEVWSASGSRWVPATVIQVDAVAGSIVLDAKPDLVIKVAEVQDRLRLRSRPSAGQLRWVRALLGEGEQGLRAEARRIYSQHVRLTPDQKPATWPLQRLSPSTVAALAAELDFALGVSISRSALDKELHTSGCKDLSLEMFERAFSDLLWRVECECGQVLMARPDRRLEDPKAVYTFEQTLGAGALGPVHFATHRAAGTRHAVKALRRSGLGDGAQLEDEQLEDEVNHLLCLDHPNIVKLYEHFDNKEGVFLIMDYCSGGALESLLVDVRLSGGAGLPTDFAADVARQVLSAAAHMHGRSIVHLDLAPANIMLTPYAEAARPAFNSTALCISVPKQPLVQQSHVMVIDFGAAQLLRPGMYTRRTPAAVCAILAPEVWQGDITPKADVFGCGALLFEMLTLMPPFECPREYVSAVDFWRKKPSIRWGHLRDAPREAIELCRKMLSLDRHERPHGHQCYRQSTYLQLSDPTCGSLQMAVQMAPSVLRGLESVLSRSWLHKSLALRVARATPASELREVSRLFFALDGVGFGCIDSGALEKALALVGVSRTTAKCVVNAMDTARSGDITWAEFVAACVDFAEPAQEKHLRRIFDDADGDRDGLLSQEDVASLFSTERLCVEVARDTFVEMTGRSGAGARVDWPTFRRHIVGSLQLAAAAGGADLGIAGAVQRGVLGLVSRASEFWSEQVRGQWWLPGFDSPGNEGDDLQQQLKELHDMGFEDRDRCEAALRRHGGDLRRTLLRELLLPAGAGGGGGDGARPVEQAAPGVAGGTPRGGSARPGSKRGGMNVSFA